MKIYHGSEDIIIKPKYESGKPNNDFGRGFYCTQDIERAKEWACKNNKNGIVNEYDKAIRKYPNVLWTHMADMVASKLMEKGRDQINEENTYA